MFMMSAAVHAVRIRPGSRLSAAGRTAAASSGPATRSSGRSAGIGAVITDATLNAALTIAQPGAPTLRFAIIGMGRLGGYEMSYPSDSDVLW